MGAAHRMIHWICCLLTPMGCRVCLPLPSTWRDCHKVCWHAPMCQPSQLEQDSTFGNITLITLIVPGQFDQPSALQELIPWPRNNFSWYTLPPTQFSLISASAPGTLFQMVCAHGSYGSTPCQDLQCDWVTGAFDTRPSVLLRESHVGFELHIKSILL